MSTHLVLRMFLWDVGLNYRFAKQFGELARLRHQRRDDRRRFACGLRFHNADVLSLRDARPGLIHSCWCCRGTLTLSCAGLNSCCRRCVTGRPSIRARRSVFSPCCIRARTWSLSKHHLTTSHFELPIHECWVWLAFQQLLFIQDMELNPCH